jgi:hypothetical protein
MRLLLDTHAFIWYTTDSSRLTATGRSLIDNGENDILLSTASVWEMAIKHSIARLTFSMPFMEFIKQQIAVNRIDILEILSTTLRLWLHCLCITVTSEFQRWYPPRHLSVESIQNLKSKILKPPHLSVGSI